MSEEPKPAAPPASSSASATGHGFTIYLVLGVAAVAAVAAAIHFKLIPLRGASAAPATEPNKLVVGYVVLKAAEQRPPGPVYIAGFAASRSFNSASRPAASPEHRLAHPVLG